MIGYYIHHHGHGHLARAAAVAAACREPVVALSSLTPPSAAPHPFAGWITLDPDPAIAEPADRRADGALHWAPLNSAGYQARMRQLSAWVGAARPRLVVVDVSVEVTALLRLLGVPVVVVAGPGRRDDEAHRLAHRLAARIIAPWPREVLQPGHLLPFAAKTSYVGAFSRYDCREQQAPPRRRRVLVMLGSGGSRITRVTLERLQSANRDWSWRGIGGADLTWTTDVWTELQAADVVVTHAGLSALAEVAAAGRPAVVVPESRPFGEQHATARALGAAGLATALPSWPGTTGWNPILLAARTQGGTQWRQWNDGSGAQRFARDLDRIETA